jgi:hypothetical protein
MNGKSRIAQLLKGEGETRKRTAHGKIFVSHTHTLSLFFFFEGYMDQPYCVVDTQHKVRK